MHTLQAILRPLTLSAHCLCALLLFVLAAPRCAADVGGPVISAAISPTTLPVTGGGITITATVTDPGGQPIKSVTGNLYRGGNYTNSVTLSNGGSGNVYIGTLGSSGNNTTSTDYVYTATVTATDTQNVSNTVAATGNSVQAHDSTPPTLTNVSIGPATLPITGGGITITATVTDPGTRAITSVTGNLYRGGNYTNSVTLSNGGSGNVYIGTLGSSGNNTTSTDYVYTATVSASNDLGLSNSAAATGNTVQAHDATPPAITSVGLSPATLPVTGGGIKVTATVTDPNQRAIPSVTGTLYRDGYYVNGVTLSNGGSGSVYTGTIASSGNNTTSADYVYTATVSASNDLGLSNSATTIGNTVQAHDNMPPLLSNLSLSPVNLPVTGGQITLMATVTDPNGRAVPSVTASLYRNGSYAGNNITLSNGGFGNVYTGNFGVGGNTGSIPYVYTASVTATSDLNLSNSAFTNGQTGQGNSGPPASLVPLLLTSDPSKPILSPAYVSSGGPDTALTISGVNFSADALVSINGVELAASLITRSSSTQITVTVPAVLLVNPGALAVSVISPSLGVLSNTVNLNVYGLVSLSVPPAVAGGSVVTAKVALNGPALSDTVIGLSSSDSSVVRLNRGVIVHIGSQSATFQINTYRSHTTKTVTIRASEGQVALTTPLTIMGR